jgi:hypothetical protein
MSRRQKFHIVVIVLSPIFIYLLTSFNNPWAERVLSVDEFMVRVNEGRVTEKQIVVRGKVEGKSIRFDQIKSELRFDLISDGSSNKIHVLLKSKEDIDLKEETIDIEGIYMVEKVFIAHKVNKR